MTTSIPSPPLEIKFDLKTVLARHEAKPGRNIHMGKFIENKKSKIFTISGEICTNGIYQSEFLNGKTKQTTFTVGILLTEENIALITSLLESLQNLVNTAEAAFEIQDIIKDDEKIYLKLKTDSSGKNFDFITNLAITPKKFSDASDAEQVTFIGEISTYFNLCDEKCGICLQPKAVLFDVLPENFADYYPKKR